MSTRLSITMFICLTAAAVAVGALFLPPREVAAPNTPPAPSEVVGAPVDVTIQSFTFTNPGPLQAGQEVVVTNNDSVPHTLTADDGSFDTGFLQPGEQAVITMPDQAGQFSFLCEVHPAMTGSFEVVA